VSFLREKRMKMSFPRRGQAGTSFPASALNFRNAEELLSLYSACPAQAGVPATGTRSPSSERGGAMKKTGACPFV